MTTKSSLLGMPKKLNEAKNMVMTTSMLAYLNRIRSVGGQLE
jgi:hypothetical protein